MLSVRRLASALFAAAVAVATVAPAPALAQVPYLQLQSSSLPNREPRYAAIVVDANSGEVLYAKRADAQRYPASISKVMTLYLVFEALQSGDLKLSDTLTVSPRAAAQSPSKLGLAAGRTISVSDAIQAVAVKSANDMAVVLAERVGGTESRFAALMTLRARELGMTNSHFVNASGLPDSRQVSTARDIAILSRAVMRDFPQYYGYFGQRQFVFNGQAMRNHNGLLGKMPGVDGLKTGYINASGFNLAASAVQDGRRLIAVVLGGPTTAARDNNVQDLLTTGFDVERRRAMGEKITVAQNLFEPEPTAPYAPSSTEQGDEGGPVQLADNSAVAPKPLVIAPSVAAARALAKADKEKAAKADAKAKKPAGEWGVQVGAFKSKSLADDQLDLIRKRYAAQFKGASGVIDGSGKTWRAQYKGFTQADAKAACAALKAKGAPCMVLSPS